MIDHDFYFRIFGRPPYENKRDYALDANPKCCKIVVWEETPLARISIPTYQNLYQKYLRGGLC
jgi:hypothetical protein